MNKLTKVFLEAGYFVQDLRDGRLPYYKIGMAVKCGKEAEELTNELAAANIRYLRDNYYEVCWIGIKSILKVISLMDLSVNHPKIRQLIAFQVMHS